MNKGIRLIYLASNSPRRKELLALVVGNMNLTAAQVDETPLPGEDGMEYVKRLAQKKATTAASQAGVDGVIIAADTTVIDRRWMEKP